MDLLDAALEKCKKLQREGKSDGHHNKKKSKRKKGKGKCSEPQQKGRGGKGMIGGLVDAAWLIGAVFSVMAAGQPEPKAGSHTAAIEERRMLLEERSEHNTGEREAAKLDIMKSELEVQRLKLKIELAHRLDGLWRRPGAV